jgi:hypothetical protein
LDALKPLAGLYGRQVRVSSNIALGQGLSAVIALISQPFPITKIIPLTICRSPSLIFIISENYIDKISNILYNVISDY